MRAITPDQCAASLMARLLNGEETGALWDAGEDLVQA
jgi:hypothetical protein